MYVSFPKSILNYLYFSCILAETSLILSYVIHFFIFRKSHIIQRYYFTLEKLDSRDMEVTKVTFCVIFKNTYATREIDTNPKD